MAIRWGIFFTAYLWHQDKKSSLRSWIGKGARLRHSSRRSTLRISFQTLWVETAMFLKSSRALSKSTRQDLPAPTLGESEEAPREYFMECSSELPGDTGPPRRMRHRTPH